MKWVCLRMGYVPHFQTHPNEHTPVSCRVSLLSLQVNRITPGVPTYSTTKRAGCMTLIRAHEIKALFLGMGSTKVAS
jgi:hypothetical protein